MQYKASNDEEQQIIDLFMESYDNKNFISEYLYSNFFNHIKNGLSICQDTDSVLEVGCGLGESSLKIAEMLSSQKFEVSEFDETYVSILTKSQFPLKVTHESVYQLTHDNNSFDCVIFLEVLEHLEDCEKALQELFRVSNKYVLISVPNEPLWRILNFMRAKYLSQLGNTPGHINHFNQTKLEKMVAKFGRIKYVSKPIPWLIMLIEKT